LNYSFHPSARQELHEAQDRYKEKSNAVALAFTDEIAWAIEQIVLSPGRWRKYDQHTRRFLLSRFPYSIIYREVDDAVQVVAVAHHRRKPSYWAPRLVE
jgi:plasmid stabilization system protein ParE